MNNPEDIQQLSPAWSHLCDAVMKRGDGAYLYDENDKRYIDFTCGIAVTGTGHCHRNVVKAIKEQADKLIFSQINCTVSDKAIELANTLKPLMPKGIDCFFFSNSGAEAVEGAVKLAKMATGKSNIIAFQGGFHGRTHLTMALTASKTIYRGNYQPLPSGIFYAPFPNAYYYGWDEDAAVDFCIRELKTMLKNTTAPEETAAIIIEPILGEGGYVPAPARFLQELRSVCDEHGILLIADEIQSGFGRAGDWLAHTQSGIVPDIITMAKGIASGMPMSVIAASQKLMSKWKKGSHGGTYGGGNAVVMAAAIATINTIKEEKLIENSREMGAYLVEKLQELQKKYPIIGNIRGRGLMIGTEFKKDGEPLPESVSKIVDYCKKQRLLLLPCGTFGNVIRWIPPLIVTKEQIDEAIGIFAQAIDNV